MAWPQPTEYNEAIQNPRHCFSDPELQNGQVVEDALGMPRPYSGNFADVYQVHGQSGQAWAVKCFTREVPTLQSRYRAISKHLQAGSPPFMVKFDYQAQGMRIRGQWYPILKMDWVEGFTLNEFVRKHADKPQVMFKLARMWVKLSLQLRQFHMAHADLQHGNVLLVPGGKTSQLSLRLIDYDGMHLPALADAPSGEVGHPNYQHPQRLREGTYSPEVDRFPNLVIYTALRCLIVGGRELWNKYDNGENLLFREADFSRPEESALLLDAWQLPDPDVRCLLGHLLLGSHLALDKVPRLDEVVGSEGRPLALTVGQERQLLDLLPPPARLKTVPILTARFSLEELALDGDEEAAAEPAGAPVAVAESPGGLRLAVGTRPPDAPDRPRRRTAVQPPPWTGPKRLSRPLWPWLVGACPRCRNFKHRLIALCPNCGHPDLLTLLTVAGLTLTSGLAAVAWLPFSQQGVLGVLGLVAGLCCVLLTPVAAALLIQIVMGPENVHADAERAPQWPAGQEACRRCGRIQLLPLFVCRSCGRMAWIRLAGLALAVLALLTLVCLVQAHAEAATWWVVTVVVVRWALRLVGLALALLLLAGVFEVWKLQARLPPTGRIRHPAPTCAMLAATLAPVLAAILLLVGLFPSTQPRSPDPPPPAPAPAPAPQPTTPKDLTTTTGTAKN